MQTYEKDVVSRLPNLVSLSAPEYNNFIFGHSGERRNLISVAKDTSLPRYDTREQDSN
jgi:hypothetical protein